MVKPLPDGKVKTYGKIARLCGNPRLSGVVGYALHVNPEPGVIPCQRVVNRFGDLSSALAFGGINEQRLLLEAEGVYIRPDDTVDLSVYFWAGGETE